MLSGRLTSRVYMLKWKVRHIGLNLEMRASIGFKISSLAVLEAFGGTARNCFPTEPPSTKLSGPGVSTGHFSLLRYHLIPDCQGEGRRLT